MTTDENGNFTVPDVSSSLQARRSWYPSAFTWMLPSGSIAPDFRTTFFITAYKKGLMNAPDYRQISDHPDTKPFFSWWLIDSPKINLNQSPYEMPPIELTVTKAPAVAYLTYYANLLAFSRCKDIDSPSPEPAVLSVIEAIETELLKLPCQLPEDTTVDEEYLRLYGKRTEVFPWVSSKLAKLSGSKVSNLTSISAKILCQAAENTGPSL